MVTEKAFLRERDGRSQNWHCQNLSCLTLNPEKAEAHLWGWQLQCPHQLSNVTGTPSTLMGKWDETHLLEHYGVFCLVFAEQLDETWASVLGWEMGKQSICWAGRSCNPDLLRSLCCRERERTLGSQLSFHLYSKCWQSPKTFLKWLTLVFCRMKIPLYLNRLLTWKIKLSECQSLSGMEMPFRFSLSFL